MAESFFNELDELHANVNGLLQNFDRKHRSIKCIVKVELGDTPRMLIGTIRNIRVYRFDPRYRRD